MMGAPLPVTSTLNAGWSAAAAWPSVSAAAKAAIVRVSVRGISFSIGWVSDAMLSVSTTGGDAFLMNGFLA
jgi:hypothetical protein